MAPPMVTSALDPDDYAALLAPAKATVRVPRSEPTLAVNRELIGLYRQLARLILACQQADGWGTRAGRNRKLSNSLLHNCPGAISPCCSTSRTTASGADGTPNKPSTTGGAATSCSTRS